MSTNDIRIDQFVQDDTWYDEVALLRVLILDASLQETYKWRTLCYTYKDRNVVLIGKFKAYITISFFKGVLLRDVKQLLVSPGANSQAVRMLKFTNASGIRGATETIKSYLAEAIEIEIRGLKLPMKAKDQFVYSAELEAVFTDRPEVKVAFQALTPGRQRAYLLHFTSAVQSATRLTRIHKVIDKILDGYGPNDCTCGMSNRLPSCDGSHTRVEG